MKLKNRTLLVLSGVITIPSLLTFSFTACSKTSEKDIPMNEKYFDIQDGTLNGFSSNVLDKPSMLKDFNTIRIDENVSEISASAFYSTTDQVGVLPIYIKTMIFDEKCSVTEIPNHAFTSNIFLKKIVFSNKILQISDNAFQNCAYLTDLTIGENVESIGDYAFDGCSNLLADGKKKDYFLFPSINLLAIGAYAFKNCIEIQNLDIPSSVTTLGEGAFYGDRSLVMLFADGINNIPNLCFFGCSELSSTTFSSSITSFGDSAFEGCLNYSPSFSFINTNFVIGSRTFFNCIQPLQQNQQTSLILSANITNIGANAFGSTGMNYLLIKWTSLSQIVFGTTPFSGTTSYGTLVAAEGVPNQVVNAVKALLPSSWIVS